MNKRQASERIYYQYAQERNIPVFASLPSDEGDEISRKVGQLLVSTGFTKVKESEKEALFASKEARILHIELASPLVARQILSPMSLDLYGQESMTWHESYRLYRFQNMAMQILAFTAKEWRLAVVEAFAQEANKIVATQVINRYLSWALMPLGIVGFWGVPVDQGMVVMKPKDSKGEAIFVDRDQSVLYTCDGARTIAAQFKILRLDPTLHGKNQKMREEELFSFLMHHCTYFDYQGPTVSIRQLIGHFSKIFHGLVHPKESFRARGGLPLQD